MQTFLPYADIDKSVKCLDYRRYGWSEPDDLPYLWGNTKEVGFLVYGGYSSVEALP